MAFKIHGVGTVISGKIATGTLEKYMSVRAEGNREISGTLDSPYSQLGKQVGSITGPSFTMKRQNHYAIDPFESHFIDEAGPGMIVGFNVRAVNSWALKREKKGH